MIVAMIERKLIERDAEILGGTPVFAGTRVPVQTLIDYLEAGHSLDDFLDDFPTVSREAAIGVLELLKQAVLTALESSLMNACRESSNLT
jgi:uncharacterized protein (DUF433 family)